MALEMLGHWLVFGGSHIVMSHPPIREYMINEFGKQKFVGIYSTVVGVSLATMIYRYSKLVKLPQNQKIIHNLNQSVPGNIAIILLQTLAGVLIIEQSNNPSPASMTSEFKDNKEESKGLLRITRHGLFTGIALAGVSQILRLPRLIDLVFWGGFPVFCVVGSMHQDYRQKNVLPAEFYEKTSAIPFVAILEGRNSLNKAIEEISPIAYYGGIGCFLLGIIPIVLRFRK